MTKTIYLQALPTVEGAPFGRYEYSNRQELLALAAAREIDIGRGANIGEGASIDRIDGGYQGALVRIRLKSSKGGDPSEWPADLRVRQFPASEARP